MERKVALFVLLARPIVILSPLNTAHHGVVAVIEMILKSQQVHITAIEATHPCMYARLNIQSIAVNILIMQDL